MTAAGQSRDEMPDKASARPADSARGQAADSTGGQAADSARGQAADSTGGQAAGALPDIAPDAAAAHQALGETDGHHHRDVSGGWLRPAVFGAMDGLVTNVSLIAGVGGGIASVGGAASRTLVLTGLAGLAAGAFSMATGEYVSVSSQNELIEAEVSKERFELENHPDAERHELAAVFRQRGVDADLADRVARQVSAHPEQALREHVREELGVDHHDLPSPVTAAAASLVTFAAGALVPLLPYLAGFDSLAAALILAAIAAFVGGGVVSRITSRPFLRVAGRQLALAAVAAGLTYGIGVLVGSVVK